MTRQRLSLLAPLALLGLLVGLTNLGHGSADEDEDYYMQELLTREQYYQVQMLEKPVASTPDRQEQPSQNPAKKVAKGKAESSRHSDKVAAHTKSGNKTPTQFWSSALLCMQPQNLLQILPQNPVLKLNKSQKSRAKSAVQLDGRE